MFIFVVSLKFKIENLCFCKRIKLMYKLFSGNSKNRQVHKRTENPFTTDDEEDENSEGIFIFSLKNVGTVPPKKVY